MPKIDAPSVVEHRAARRAALLDAAVALLHEAPERVPTLAEVGARSGLSRSSVYHYFESNQALLAAVVEETFPRWQRRFDAAYGDADTPADRIRAYVRENLRLVADGEHALARTLVNVAQGHDFNVRSAEFHSALTAPLAEALRELGEPNVDLAAEMVNAIVLTGARRVEAGDDVAAVEAATERLLGPFLSRS
jgi:AcrR family transcriptional regulator